MKISLYTPIHKLPSYNGNSQQNQQQTSKEEYKYLSYDLFSKNYFNYAFNPINFKARLNRTPENFYAQKFNQENMPDTVKNYLNEDFETRQHMPPAQLQREAFQYIKIADTVDEVKEMYPDEPLFKDLKPFEKTRATSGILLLLRWDKQTQNTPVFKNKDEKDLTLYLLKKVYLEGKTLDEINKDFDKDTTDEIKKELGVKDGKYFYNSTLRAMGIRYPELSYYNSFLATRNDKEYIPVSRKMSDATKEKISEASKSWWAGLNEIERSEQIQKMLEGKSFSNSIFTRFQGQIMTIASSKIGFSDRLSEIFSEKLNDDEFNSDFPSFTQKMREIMLEFWNKDTEFKNIYSDAIRTTIMDFDEAYNDKNNPEKLEKLLNQALELKSKILEKAKSRRQHKNEMKKLAHKTETTSQGSGNVNKIENSLTKKEIYQLFKQNERAALKIYPDDFAKEFLDYLIENTDFNTKKTAVLIKRPDAKELLNLTEEEYLKTVEDLKEQIEIVNHDFNNSHRLTAKTNEFLINNYLYNKSHNTTVFYGERGDAFDIINVTPEYKEDLLKNKPLFNKQFKLLCKPLNARDSLDFLKNNIIPVMNKMAINGSSFYKLPKDFLIRVKEIENALSRITSFQNESTKFIQNYNAYIKFMKQCNNEILKQTICEHIAVDYFMYLQEKIRNNKQQPKQTVQRNTNISGIDDIPEKELLNAFRHLSEKQLKFFDDDFKNELYNFIITHPKMDKKLLAIFSFIESGYINELKLDPNQRNEIIKNTENIFIAINKEFDKKYPELAISNEFAMNLTIYEQTGNKQFLKNTRADNMRYIVENKLDDTYMKLKPIVSKRYKEYSDGLTIEEAQEFYENTLSAEISKLYTHGFKYHKDIQQEVLKKLLNIVLTQIDKQEIIDFIKAYKGAVMFINDKTRPNDAAELLKEHIIYDFLCERVPELIKINQ